MKIFDSRGMAMIVPNTIYLQVRDGDGDEPDEVTWCVDRVYDTDVEYVLNAEEEQCPQKPQSPPSP